MKNTQVQYFTYARTILSDIEGLSSLIRKYASTQQSRPKSKLKTPLTLEQIQKALTNPQNGLRPDISAFATLLKIEQDILKVQEDIQEEREVMRETIRQLREKHTLTIDPMQKEKLSDALKTAEALFQKTSQLYQDLNRSQIELKKYYTQINKIAEQHDEEWHQFRGHYLQELERDLVAAGVELSEIEKKELLSDVTWAQLIQDFETLNIQIPDYLNIASPNFETYFKLKAYLAIHSSLSRRMQPHKPQDVLKYLKTLLRK